MKFLLRLFSFTAILLSLAHFFSQSSISVTSLSHVPLIASLCKITLVTAACSLMLSAPADFAFFQFLLQIQSIPGGTQRPASPDVLLT